MSTFAFLLYVSLAGFLYPRLFINVAACPIYLFVLFSSAVPVSLPVFVCVSVSQCPCIFLCQLDCFREAIGTSFALTTSNIIFGCDDQELYSDAWFSGI